jgi:ABC-type multidrug transport system fused ATPase/permease subunit
VPYRRIVLISVLSAFFVGLVFSSGLGAMLPILRVLINNDTLATWMDRQVTGAKIDATLDESDSGVITRVEKNGRAAQAGVQKGDKVANLPDAATSEQIQINGANGVIRLTANPLKWHLRVGHRIAHWFPNDHEWGAVKTIAIILLFLTVIGIIGNVVRFFQEYLSDKAAISATNDVRRHLYDHVMRIPLRSSVTPERAT